jgi:hypothetical protein
MDFINRYSYVILGLVLIASAITYGALTGEVTSAVMITMGTTAAFLVYFTLARRVNRTPTNPEKRISRMIGSGRPLIIYFYSDFDLGSLVARPFSAAAERRFRTRCDFLYISMSHPDADLAAESVGGGLGLFVIYDAKGERLGQTRLLQTNKVQNLLERSA